MRRRAADGASCRTRARRPAQDLPHHGLLPVALRRRPGPPDHRGPVHARGPAAAGAAGRAGLGRAGRRRLCGPDRADHHRGHARGGAHQPLRPEARPHPGRVGLRRAARTHDEPGGAPATERRGVGRHRRPRGAHHHRRLPHRVPRAGGDPADPRVRGDDRLHPPGRRRRRPPPGARAARHRPAGVVDDALVPADLHPRLPGRVGRPGPPQRGGLRDGRARRDRGRPGHRGAPRAGHHGLHQGGLVPGALHGGAAGAPVHGARHRLAGARRRRPPVGRVPGRPRLRDPGGDHHGGPLLHGAAQAGGPAHVLDRPGPDRPGIPVPHPGGGGGPRRPHPHRRGARGYPDRARRRALLLPGGRRSAPRDRPGARARGAAGRRRALGVGQVHAGANAGRHQPAHLRERHRGRGGADGPDRGRAAPPRGPGDPGAPRVRRHRGGQCAPGAARRLR